MIPFHAHPARMAAVMVSILLAAHLGAAGQCLAGEPYAERAFSRTFRIHTEVDLDLRTPLAGSLAIEAVGSMDLRFTPTSEPQVFDVVFERLSLRFGPFGLPWAGADELRIRGLHVGPADLVAEESVGTYDGRTGEVRLKLVLRLDPSRQSALAQLGMVEPVSLEIVESGRIDLDSGYLSTATAPFEVQLGALGGTVAGRQFSPCTKGIFPDPSEVWEVVMACPDGESFVEICCGTEEGQTCTEAGAFDLADEVGPAACIAVSVLDLTPCSLSRCPVI